MGVGFSFTFKEDSPVEIQLRLNEEEEFDMIVKKTIEICNDVLTFLRFSHINITTYEKPSR